MFQLQNFSILTDVQFCTKGWGAVYSAVQCGVQWLSQEAGEVIRAQCSPHPAFDWSGDHITGL